MINLREVFKGINVGEKIHVHEKEGG